MTRALCAAMLLVVLGACNPGSEEAFVQGRAMVPCDQNIPVCPGLFAACKLGSTGYTKQAFPAASPFRFLVEALPRETIEVSMYFSEQQDVGLDTRIMWYEPGCSDVYIYKSEGEDLFVEAKDTGYTSRREMVYEGGEHLVEIFTDMQALVVVKTDVYVAERP